MALSELAPVHARTVERSKPPAAKKIARRENHMAANTKQENTAPSRASALPPTHTNESVAVAVRACGDHSNIKLTVSPDSTTEYK